MHGIHLNFASLAALAAALPYLAATPGLLHGDSTATTAGNANPGAATALTASTAVAATTQAAAPAPSPMNFGTPAVPTFTFEQVGAALQAYHGKDAAAFASAMQKFAFTSMTDVQNSPTKWGEVMVYIGAAQPPASAAEAPTIDKVGRVLQLWSQANAAGFQAAMVAQGLASMPDVHANPGKWAALLAAAAAVGIS